MWSSQTGNVYELTLPLAYNLKIILTTHSLLMYNYSSIQVFKYYRNCNYTYTHAHKLIVEHFKRFNEHVNRLRLYNVASRRNEPSFPSTACKESTTTRKINKKQKL